MRTHAPVLLALGLLVAGCKVRGDWRASRDSFCRSVTANGDYLKLTFAIVDTLASARDGSLQEPSTDAAAAVAQLRGLVDGLATAEAALYAGAPDTTEDRAMFVTSADAGDALMHVGMVERPALLRACESNDRAYVRGWLDRAHKARGTLEARFEQQAKDCAAVGAPH